VLLAFKLRVYVEVGKAQSTHRTLKSHGSAAPHQDLKETSRAPQAQWVMCWEEVWKPKALPISTVLHLCSTCSSVLQVLSGFKQMWLFTWYIIKGWNTSPQHAADGRRLMKTFKKK